MLLVHVNAGMNVTCDLLVHLVAFNDMGVVPFPCHRSRLPVRQEVLQWSCSNPANRTVESSSWRLLTSQWSSIKCFMLDVCPNFVWFEIYLATILRLSYCFAGSRHGIVLVFITCWLCFILLSAIPVTAWSIFNANFTTAALERRRSPHAFDYLSEVAVSKTILEKKMKNTESHFHWVCSPTTLDNLLCLRPSALTLAVP